ncbi:sensor domain-containing diguanylate cyclase [Vibrio japonicus]|uniref:diguanylate cyclase n=1 Tax=Vibrio japonicus TaxID=1824638 RepID=A0ABY5LLQ2_9VIBR|nr:diguanylate cyclase [Vibrio japonicus]UUM33039.1 diguanylate cyclase [Vibrio japonicus]
MKLTKQEYVSTKSVISVITWLFCAMIIVVLAGIWYFLTILDTQAENALKHRVELTFAIESRHSKDILGEYTFWDESYEKIFVKHDPNWVELNSGLYLLNEFDLDFSIAVNKDSQQVYFIKSDDASSVNFNDLMSNGLRHLIEKSSSRETKKSETSGFIQLGDNLYFVVGGPLISEETELPRKDAYLAIGKRIDQEYLDELVSNYQLVGLKHSFIAPEQAYRLAIHSIDGNPAGYLTWQPNSPSETILFPIAVIIVLVSFATALVTRRILNKELGNRQAYEEKLYLEATTDPLTKINNRRYFMDVGNKEFYLYQRQKSVFTLLLLDIDHFKSINDTYGHHAGDQVLIQFSELCGQHLRKSDIFGRIGGEEFGVVLPDTDIEQAKEIANRIRLIVLDNPVLVSNTPIDVSVSIGMATLRSQECFDVLLQDADQALYDAKREGRNRVSINVT